MVMLEIFMLGFFYHPNVILKYNNNDYYYYKKSLNFNLMYYFVSI